MSNETKLCYPECGSDSVTCEEYNYGIDPESGYRDSGERFRCLKCGAKGDASDLMVCDGR